MKEQFVNYGIATKFKGLGFNDPCFGYFPPLKTELTIWYNPEITNDGEFILAPLWQQACDWLVQRLDFYYPMLELRIFSDESGTWYQSLDKLTNNEEVDIVFDDKEGMIWEAIKLLEK